MTAGEAQVPAVAGIVLPPDVSAELAPVSATSSVYPAESLVLTVTVSLWMVCAPEPVGIMLSLTVPELEILMTGLRTELTVVEAVAAETNVAIQSGDNTAKTSDMGNRLKWESMNFCCMTV